MKSVQLTDGELQALIGLMDAAVKSIGLASAKNAAHLLTKLEAAEEIEAEE